MPQLCDKETKENDGSGSEDAVLPSIVAGLEGVEKIPIETNSTQERLTRGRKHAIATLLILGNSILVSKIKESSNEQAT
jgi:hypothetical protein